MPDNLMTIEQPPLTDVFGKPETWKNPYSAYREFRDRSPFVAQWPVILLDGSERQVRAWMLLKYEQVNAALRDPASFSSEQPGSGSVAPKLVMISDDPPRPTCGSRRRETASGHPVSQSFSVLFGIRQ